MLVAVCLLAQLDQLLLQLFFLGSRVDRVPVFIALHLLFLLGRNLVHDHVQVQLVQLQRVLVPLLFGHRNLNRGGHCIFDVFVRLVLN